MLNIQCTQLLNNSQEQDLSDILTATRNAIRGKQFSQYYYDLLKTIMNNLLQVRVNGK